MAKTPEYVKRATANYQAKYDLIQVRFPKGTRERIQEKATGTTINDYIVGLVVADLEAHQEQPGQIAIERPKYKPNPVHEAEDFDKLNEYLKRLQSENEQRKQLGSDIDAPMDKDTIDE